MDSISCDVLVIGGGGAGLMAAVNARQAGASVQVVGKQGVGSSGSTVMAPGAMAAVADAWKLCDDSTALHLSDTLRSGCGINSLPLAKAVAEGAADAVLALEKMGALFDRDDETGLLRLLRTDGGHSCMRAISAQRRIGLEIIRALKGQCLRDSIPMLDNTPIAQLLRDGRGSICGALGYNAFTLRPVLLRCKAAVLATGGAGNLYALCDTPLDVTGDGMALALSAGARLTDMEFIQFHPLGMTAPVSMRGFLGAHLSVVRLYNSLGERFMERYDPQHLELTTRDRLSAAIMTEVREGRGTASGGVYAGMEHLSPAELEQKVPEYCRMYRRLGFDPSHDRLELAPTVHYTMGGVRVDSSWATDLPGLYAAGECCGGVHGANRLSQNALTEMLVSGGTAGKGAAQWAGEHPHAEALPEIDPQPLSESSAAGLTPGQWRRELKALMSAKVGVLRSEESLKEALSELEALDALPAVLPSRGEVRAAAVHRENRLMSLTAQCVIRSALARKESRGAHNRLDYPHSDDSYLGNFDCVMTAGGVSTEFRRKEAEVP